MTIGPSNRQWALAAGLPFTMAAPLVPNSFSLVSMTSKNLVGVTKSCNAVESDI